MTSATSRRAAFAGILARSAVPAAAAVGALVIAGLIIAALGASPVEGLKAMVAGSLGGARPLTDTINKAVPLLLVGAGIVVAFRANVINIGGEGQIVLGALAAAATALALPGLPSLLLLPATILAGLAGGAAWGWIPGVLKARFSVNEILSTIMLNIVAIQLMNFLLRGPMIDPAEVAAGTRIPQTVRLPPASDLPIIYQPTQLSAGILIALVAALLVYVLMWRTTFGFRLRAVGHNPHASRYAGISVPRSIVTALTVSGALCGLAGAVLVLGSGSHRLVTDGSTAGFTGNAGFNGIVVALFGGLHPLGAIPAAGVFGALLVGANKVQRALQVPSALMTAINGLVVVFVVSSDRLRDWIRQKVAGDVSG